MKFFDAQKELTNYLIDKFLSNVPEEITNKQSMLEIAKDLQSRVDEIYDKAVKSNITKADEAFFNIAKAYSSEDKSERIELAKKALELDENCVDAYLLLASEETDSDEEALKMIDKAIEIAVSKMSNSKHPKGFWATNFATREYLRAIGQKSDLLWKMGRRSEAVELMEKMVLYDVLDMYEVKYHLINRFLLLDMIKNAEKLIRLYDDDKSTHWFYGKAYIEFRKGKNKSLAKEKLLDAFYANPYVPFFLLNILEIPETLSPEIKYGSVEEAVEYLELSERLWTKNSSALNWFKKIFEEEKFELILFLEKRKSKD